MPSTCLELELIESAIMTEPARARAALDQLAALGITLSVDDFVAICRFQQHHGGA